MKRRALIASAVLCLAVTTLHADDHVVPPTGGSFTGAPRASDLTGSIAGAGFSLLDPSRFRIHNSYSLSFLSGSGRSASVGMFMSTIEYQLSRPLSLRVGLGYLHQPLGFLKNVNGPDQGRILPNVSLDYRPSDKFRFSVDFRTVPSSVDGMWYGWGGTSPYRGGGSLWDW